MKCLFCNTTGHTSRRCPTLADDLDYGFYKGKRDPTEEPDEKCVLFYDDPDSLFYLHPLIGDMFYPYTSSYHTRSYNTSLAEHIHYKMA